MTTHWSSLFTEQYPVEGASELELQAVASSLFGPLTEQEVSAINASQSNPFPASNPLHKTYKPFDPRKWWLPAGPLPASYLGFLRWSNGGSFLNGDRRFDPFLSAAELREYLLCYHFPQYMPGAIPFAFDGGGCFYVFDMRREPSEGDYPILFIGAGNLGYDDSVQVGSSFLEACKGSTKPSYLTD